MLRMAAIVMAAALAIVFLIAPSLANAPIAVIDTTMTVNQTGAIHVKVVQTAPDDSEGTVTYHFDLQKTYLPENVEIYDYLTGNPLQYTLKETSDTYGYDVAFDKPYYDGYTFVVEYDCHRRIVYEGNGVYTLGFRASIDTKRIDRTYTVILPVVNFTYLGYASAMDHPTSETSSDAGTQVVFHNVSNAGADYAWELRFKATGIDGDVYQLSPPDYSKVMPVPGMSFIAAITALLILMIVKRK